MKVVLVSRSKVRGRFSLEILFRDVATELRRTEEVVEYSLTTKWGSWQDVRALRRLKADVYHITGDCHQVALVLPRRRTIVTVADMNHLLFDLAGIRRWVFKTLWFDLPPSRVAAVTSISQATKRALDEHCPGIRAAVDVIECCVSPRYKPVPRRFHDSNPRVLFVGTAAHKNLLRLARALEGIPCTLVTVGQIDEATRNELGWLGVNYENHVRLTDEELKEQYISCDLVAFPSEREGFGLPIVEGQAVGRPVVTSDLSPMREVAGGGACLVDPFDVADIRRGVLDVIRDQDYRAGLVERGAQNVRRYSAESIAAQYLDVYRGVTEYFDD